MTPKLRNRCRRHGAARAAKGGHKRAKLWRAMRILRTFTTDELLAVTELTSRDAVRTYCRYLVRTGFLVSRRDVHPAHASYQLVRDTGPEPPLLVHRGSAIYDQNTDIEYPLAGGAE